MLGEEEGDIHKEWERESTKKSREKGKKEEGKDKEEREREK